MMSPDNEPSVAYCTIASANYLGRVQTLLRSLERHDPGVPFIVLLCEAPELCRQLSEETGVQFWSPEEVCADWREMAFYYDITEFNTALKPFLLRRILDRGFTGVIYFDPDVEVYGQPAPVGALLSRHDVVLTPHVCKPVFDDGRGLSMHDLIRAGQFNLGFVGIAGTENGRSMLTWWESVCRDRCLLDLDHGFFVDQLWAAAFASFAERCCILRDPGCNVAYWNVFQRELTQVGQDWRIDGRPLVFFHFSGLTTDDLTRVSRHQDRVRALPGSALHELLRSYWSRVQSTPWQRYAQTPYSFASYHDGDRISGEDRRRFLYLGLQGRREVGDPFANKESIRKIEWVHLGESHRPAAVLRRIEGVQTVAVARFQEFVRAARTRGLLTAVRLTARLALRKLTRSR